MPENPPSQPPLDSCATIHSEFLNRRATVAWKSLVISAALVALGPGRGLTGNSKTLIIRDDVRYEVYGNQIEGFDLRTHRVIWQTTIWVTTFLPWVTLDVPWNVVGSIRISGDALEVRDNGGSLLGLIDLRSGRDRFHNSFSFWLRIHWMAFLAELIVACLSACAVWFTRKRHSDCGSKCWTSFWKIWPPIR
jgi:hypothetical protein